MGRYIARRLILLIPVVFLVTLIAFLLIMILPGDPALALMGDQMGHDPVQYAAFRQELGLDRPLPLQYVSWLGRALRGDLGTSIRNKEPVLTSIANRLGPTVELGIVSLLIALVVALPTAIFSALKPGSTIDAIGTLVAVGGMAVPGFWLGIILMYIFAVWLEVLPPSGYVPITEDPADSLRRMIMPGLTVASWITVGIMRQLRASLIEVMQSEYITVARAKGLVESAVVLKHALRNAFIPVLTVLGGTIGHLYAGTIIGETIFSIPGVGRLAADSVYFRDFPVTQGVVLLASLSVLLTNLATDILYAYVDPRIRYS